MATLVQKSDVLNPDCRVRRALDGRVICATNPRVETAISTSASDDALDLLPGQYVVIGSFREHENAVRWARSNEEFATEIKPAPLTEPTMYRVVIGPLEQDTQAVMGDILRAVGVDESWRLSVCADSETMLDGHCTSLDDAPRLADAAR